MNQGERIVCDNIEYEVLKSLGKGGQGEVYKLKRLSDGGFFAAKIIIDKDAQRLAIKKDNIYSLVSENVDEIVGKKGFPHKINHIFPVGHFSVNGNLAYIMEYAGGKTLDRMLQDGELQRMSLTEKMRLSKQIATSISILHDIGYCYTDISWGNFMYDRGSGWLYLIDCENVASDAEIQKGMLNFILGTNFFIAPEVAFSLARAGMNADRYALANMIFRIFTNNLIPSPYHGKAIFNEDDPTPCQNMMDVKDWVDEGDITDDWRMFIFDSNNLNNRIDGIFTDPTMEKKRKKRAELDEVIRLWGLLDDRLKELFCQAFADPLEERNFNGRPAAFEWIKALDEVLTGKARAKNVGFKVNNGGTVNIGSCVEFAPNKSGTGGLNSRPSFGEGNVENGGLKDYPDFVPASKTTVGN